MNWDKDIDLSKLKFTSRLIIERVLNRGWSVVSFKSNSAIFLIKVPGRKGLIKIFSASPSQMSYPASKIVKDKYITNQMLTMEGLPVPKELLVSSNQLDLDEQVKNFLADNKLIVVKPLDASHGKGITVNVSSEDDIKIALKVAGNVGGSLTLLQEQIEGIDIRIICTGYKFVDAISRIPASVVGDGEHTVRQLIELVNVRDDRGLNYTSKYNIIPIDKVEAYMDSSKLTTIPFMGETVQVIGVSNVGMGGIRQNIKSDIPEFLKEIAVLCAKTLELPVCGVDFIVKRAPKYDDTIEDLRPYVIEVNECPSLAMHDDLYSLEENEIIDGYLDFVATYPDILA